MIMLLSIIFLTISPFPELPLNEGSAPSISLEKEVLLKTVPPINNDGNLLPWMTVLLSGFAMLAFINRTVISEYIFPEIKEPPPTPLQSLSKLKALNLPRKGSYKEFYTGITNIIRDEVMHRSGYFVAAETTEELLDTIQSRSAFDIPAQHSLQEILAKAELIKFGRQDSTVDECERMINALQGILERTMKKQDGT